MIKSLESAKSALTLWQGLKASRPTDFSAEVPGAEGVTYELVESLLSSWVDRLNIAMGAKWIESGEAIISDLVISKKLRDLGSLVSQAASHGLPWLLVSTTFTELVTDTTQLIAAFSGRRASIASQLAKELKRDSVMQIGQIIEAAKNAEIVNSSARDANISADEADTAAQLTKEQLDVAKELTRDLSSVKDQISEAHSYSKSKRDEIELIFEDVVTVQGKAEAAANRLSENINQLSTDVENAKLLTNSSVADLKQALLDVRRQGLAGAFTTRANSIRTEHLLWLALFCLAAIGLGYLAIEFAVELQQFTYEALIVALLRRVALAAPMIWLGWYAARQVSRVSRIKEDYEYKAATALAFESYKKEVEASESDDLLKQLLSAAITNFGDNPTRFYGTEHKEPSTPTEDLLSKIEHSGTLKLMERLKKLYTP